MRRGLVRHAVAWVAVLCVYMQLVAAAVCATGAPTDGGPFPICHAQAQESHAQAQEGGGPSDGHTPPAPDHHCPFCAAHCHAAASLSPTPKHVVRPAVAAAIIERPAFAIHATPRVVAGASPRGPPPAV